MKFRRFAPDSIFGWLTLILIAGLAASQALTALAHNIDRNETAIAVNDFNAAERIANLVGVLQHTAPVFRPGLASSFSGQSMSIAVTNRSSVPENEKPDSRLNRLARAVSERLEGHYWQEIRIASVAANEDQEEARLMPIRISVALRDGAWINIEFVAVESLPLATPGFIAWTICSVLLVLGLSFFAFRRVTHPLESLTRAAESLGRSGRTEALEETGASEVRRAARAFNEMQGRIRRLLEDRMQMVAAISHDLRTPITRLKLRAEFVEDQEQREKMLRDLDEMETMIKETLALAREDANPEPRSQLDLAQLLADSVEGLEHVTLEIDPALSKGAATEAQPIALKRAVVNLIENAVVYGKSARVRLAQTPKDFEITITDEGPGIPEAELDRVFRPFYRLEASRNRESGGAGLGLAIARSIVRSNGGDIVLANRPEGGLRAAISLPK
jgi:signal transduction histidine kinase